MAAAVALDLLARPARWRSASGPAWSSRPGRCAPCAGGSSVLRRYRELVRLCRQEGFGPFLAAAERAERTVDAPGVRLRRVLEQAGGVYIKLGQIAATRVDLLPREVCDELAELQNRVPAESAGTHRAGARSRARRDRSTRSSPSSTGSRSRRRRSARPTGPGCARASRSSSRCSGRTSRRLMERDLAALALLADLAQRRTPFGQGLRSGEMLAQFADGLRAELDFRHEADAMTRDGGAARRTARRCASRRSTGSCVEPPGARAGALRGLHRVATRAGSTTAASIAQTLADQLLRATLDQVMRLGLFHADPHPGNVFALADGTLGLIDFGAVGRLDPIQQSAIVDIMVALARRDVEPAARRRRAGRRRRRDDLAGRARAGARPLDGRARPARGHVDPAVIQDLVATLSRFGLRLPTDVVLLSRALVTVDGTLRALCPGHVPVAAATDVRWHRDGGQPVVDRSELVRDELLAMVPHLRRLPERVDRILTLTGRGELRVRSVVDEDSRRILRTLANRLLLVLAGASFLVASAWLLVAADDGPQVAGETGLFDVFGYGGLLDRHRARAARRRRRREGRDDMTEVITDRRSSRPSPRAAVRRAAAGRALLPPSRRRRPAGPLGTRHDRCWCCSSSCAEGTNAGLRAGPRRGRRR